LIKLYSARQKTQTGGLNHLLREKKDLERGKAGSILPVSANTDRIIPAAEREESLGEGKALRNPICVSDKWSGFRKIDI
jgi:hypothetical protein